MIRNSVKPFDFDFDSSIFTSIFILGSCAISMAMTIGFPRPTYDYFIICGVALVLVNFSLVYKTVFSIRDQPGLDSILTSLLFFSLLIFSFLPGIISTILVFSISSCGYISLFYILAKPERRFSKLFIWILFPSLLLIWVAGFVYSSTFHHPLYLEKISLGLINHDQLFHTSITEMIRTYRIPSTGLYGTPYVPYHFGSHIIMAMLSNLFDINAIMSYNILYPILFIPLYFRVMLFVVKDLVRVIFKKEEVVSDWVFWGLFIILIINFLPNDLTFQHFAMWDSWMISESYLISLLFLFLAISVSLAITRDGNSKIQTLLYSILLCVILIFMGFSKISVLIVGAGATWYLIIRSGRWRSPWLLSIGIILFAIVVFALKVTTRHSVTSQIFYPLHFVKVWISQSWRAFFVPVFYLTLIIYILARLGTSIKSISDLKTAVRLKLLIDVEFLVVIAILGICPALLFSIEGGSGLYFMDIQARVAVVFLAAFLLFERTEELSNQSNSLSISGFIRKNAFLSCIALILVLSNVLSKFEDFVNANLKLRFSMIQKDSKQSKFYGDYPDFYKYLSGDIKQLGEKMNEIAYLPGKIVNESAAFNYYKWLSDTCSQIKDKDQYYITLEKHSTFFTTAHPLNWAAPFILPTVTGMALTNGLPASIKDFEYFGYANYKGLSMDSLECSKAFQKKILILSPYTKKIVPCE